MICSFMSDKGRKTMQTLCLVVGVISLAFGIIGALNTPEEQHSLMRLMGMLTGAGAGIIAVAIVMTVRARVVKPEKLKQEEIDAKDERNITLMRTALSVAAFVAMLVFAVLAFVFIGLGFTLPGVLCLAGMYAEVIAFVIARAVLNKRM